MASVSKWPTKHEVPQYRVKFAGDLPPEDSRRAGSAVVGSLTSMAFTPTFSNKSAFGGYVDAVVVPIISASASTQSCLASAGA